MLQRRWHQRLSNSAVQNLCLQFGVNCSINLEAKHAAIRRHKQALAGMFHHHLISSWKTSTWLLVCRGFLSGKESTKGKRIPFGAERTLKCSSTKAGEISSARNRIVNWRLIQNIVSSSAIQWKARQRRSRLELHLYHNRTPVWWRYTLTPKIEFMSDRYRHLFTATISAVLSLLPTNRLDLRLFVLGL